MRQMLEKLEMLKPRLELLALDVSARHTRVKNLKETNFKGAGRSR